MDLDERTNLLDACLRGCPVALDELADELGAELGIDGVCRLMLLVTDYRTQEREAQWLRRRDMMADLAVMRREEARDQLVELLGCVPF